MFRVLLAYAQRVQLESSGPVAGTVRGRRTAGAGGRVGGVMDRKMDRAFRTLDALRRTVEELRTVCAEQADAAREGTGTSADIDALDDATESVDACLEALERTEWRLEEVRDHLTFLKEGGLL